MLPLCPSSNGKHSPIFHQFLDGTVYTVCGPCSLPGGSHPNLKLAREYWNKEKTMSATNDYDRGFKDGVVKADWPIIVANLADQYVNDVLSNRRKRLLTKKVTKWFFLYKPLPGGLPTSSLLYNTEYEALNGSFISGTTDIAECVLTGPMSFEIEEAL